jgi:hypothetical protein
MNGKSVQQINKNMMKYVPELESTYATYPMARSRWLEPTETGDRGEPCFFLPSSATIHATVAAKAENEACFKIDYVFCERGPLGRGYYSLLTKTAYVNLYSRMSMQGGPPGGCSCCCAFSKAARQAYDDWDDVKRIVFGRHVAPRPDDQAAKQAAVDNFTPSHDH